jgi:hypothetical protein
MGLRVHFEMTAAKDNLGSVKVLQKWNFKIVGENKNFAEGRGEETEEYICRLDGDGETQNPAPACPVSARTLAQTQ